MKVAADGSIRPQAPISCSGTQHVTVSLQAEPGATLGGPLTAGVTVKNIVESVTISGQATVNVVDPTDASAATIPTPPATPVASDTVYTDHIGRPGNVDYFRLPAQPVGSEVIVTLSHVRRTTTSLLYGNATSSLRGAPFHRPFHSPFHSGTTPVLVDDSSQSPVDDGSITPPELLQDVPQLPGATIRDASVQRGTTDEAVFTTTTGDDSRFHHPGERLQRRLEPAAVLLAGDGGHAGSVVAVFDSELHRRGTTGSLPASLDPATRTLILVNQKRLGDMYGPAAADAVMAKLQALAGYTDQGGNHDFDVRGAVIPVDGDPTVAADYAAWDDSPCSVGAANTIVTDINRVVDRLRPGSARSALCGGGRR